MMALELRPMRGGELLDRTISVLRQYIRLFAGIIVVALAAGLVIPLIFLARGFQPGSLPRPSLTLLYVLVTFAFWAVLGPVTMGAFAAATDRLVRHETPSLRDSWIRAVRRAPALIGAVILKFMALWAAALVLVIPLMVFVFTRTLRGPAGIIAAVITLVLGTAGVSFFVWVLLGLSLQDVLVVLEGAGPLASLKRSWELTRGGRWRIFFILLLYWIFTAMTQILLKLLFPHYGVWLIQHGVSPIWEIVLSHWTGVLVSVPLYAIVGVGMPLEYFNQRMQKEAFDLEVMMSSLTSPQAMDAE